MNGGGPGVRLRAKSPGARFRSLSGAKRTLSKVVARQAECTRTSPYVAGLALVDRAALIASSLISLRATSKLQWI